MAFRTRVAPVRSPASGIGLRVLLTLAGAAGLIVSAFTHWISDIRGLDLWLKALVETTLSPGCHIRALGSSIRSD